MKSIDIEAHKQSIVVVPIQKYSYSNPIWVELNLFKEANYFYPKQSGFLKKSKIIDLPHIDSSKWRSFNPDIIRYFNENDISFSENSERFVDFENDVPHCEYKMLTTDLRTFSFPMDGIDFWIADHLLGLLEQHNDQGGSGQANGLVWYDGHWRMSNGSVQCN